MKIPSGDILDVLAQYNPWWRSAPFPDLPNWRRAPWREIYAWTANPEVHRAVLVSGARQVGKTTLLLQAIAQLLAEGVHPGNILYATLDHPLFKLAGIDAVLKAWQERFPRTDAMQYLFLDEAQFIPDWGTWVKHQVDFDKRRRLVLTGSALPLVRTDQESGVGRWHQIKISTLSFYEYLRIQNIHLPALPAIRGLHELFPMKPAALMAIQDAAQAYIPHFAQYLLRGGFPQAAQVASVTQAQRLLREDIVDRVLKRDMTALYGVRRVLELERAFLYLCMHNSGLLDFQTLCENLEVQRPTAQNFIDILEAAHLIYKLAPLGHGKQVLRAKYKIYLADAAIAPAVMLKGEGLLQDTAALGIAVETAVFKHLYARYYRDQVRFSYWRGKREQEVDVVAELGDQLIPFEIKHRTSPAAKDKVRGLSQFCEKHKVPRAYLVTREVRDLGLVTNDAFGGTPVMQVPAALLCYWTGESETTASATSED